MKILQGFDNTFYLAKEYAELTKEQAEEIVKHTEHDLAMAKRFLEVKALEGSRAVEHTLEGDLANQGVDMPDQNDQLPPSPVDQGQTTDQPAPAEQTPAQPAQDQTTTPVDQPAADPNAQPAPTEQPAPVDQSAPQNAPVDQPAPAVDANGNPLPPTDPNMGQPQEQVMPPLQ